MTSPTIGQVDGAVRAVLAGLRRATGPDRRPSSGMFAGRLLGQRQVEAIGADVREVRIAPTTVITPIARDLLKRRGIAVRLVSEREAARKGEWGFAIEPGSAFDDVLKRAILSSEGGWYEVGVDAVEAARWVAEDSGRGAVVFSREASVACWLSGRVRGVRAASPACADGVSRAVEHLGMNLLVVEARGLSIPETMHWLKIFRKSGAPEPPSWLVEEIDHEDRRGDRPSDLLQAPSERQACSIAHRCAPALRGDRRGIAEAGGGADRLR